MRPKGTTNMAIHNATTVATPADHSHDDLHAVRHPVTAQVIVMPGEELSAFQSFGQNFFAELLPCGVVENQLVQTLADTQWRLNRIRAHEANLFALGHQEHAPCIQTGEPSIQAALAAAVTLRNNTELLKSLGTHEQQLSRLLQSTLNTLTVVQRARRRRERENVRTFHASE